MTITELMALHALTTGGEWRSHSNGISSDIHSEWYEDEFHKDNWPNGCIQVVVTDGGHYPPDENTKAFIAAAHTSLPALAERMARLEAALRFYADKTSYYEDMQVDFPFRSTKIQHDSGQRACDVLGEEK